MVSAARLPERPRVLDLGAGWGLSSEFLATLGCIVDAVDINPKFVELIQRRQKHHRLPVSASAGTFDDFSIAVLYDAVLFYECLHHALRPWKVVERCAQVLKPNGVLMFAGEPIKHLLETLGPEARSRFNLLHCQVRMV